MPLWTCEQCGAQFPESAEPPPACPVCEDERQYVNWKGQTWLTREELAKNHKLVWRDDLGIAGIGVEPGFAIGQRALLVRETDGCVMWDCVPLATHDAIEYVRSLGGQKAIADRNAIPSEARLYAVRVTSDEVRNLRRHDQPGSQPASECEAAERDRSVEQNCRNEELRRQQVDNPRDDQQRVAEQGHRNGLLRWGGGALPGARTREAMDRTAKAEELLRELGGRARLVVYVASAPGAGKTRRLLEDGRRLQAGGKRVAIGWIETKGRPDLESWRTRTSTAPLVLNGGRTRSHCASAGSA